VKALKPELLAILREERAAKWELLNLLALERLAECPRCQSLIDPQAGADVRTGCDLTDCPQGRPFRCRQR